MTTTIGFPSGLPVALNGSLKAKSTDPWVGDPSSVGRERRRARFTRSIESFSFNLMLTQSQLDDLSEFYHVTLKNGVLSFNWKHPVRGTSYEVNFDAHPAQSQISGNKFLVAVGVTEI